MKAEKFGKGVWKCVIVVLLIMGVAGLVVSCQDEEAKRAEKRQEHYQKGLALLEEGKLNEAIIEFKTRCSKIRILRRPTIDWASRI
ncbi:hypothetical protein GF339_14170 [candidate division KSB3 bacterium]|uniref:Tetratricopeptide repeat protein n=1 Tax=candidate division KSB3 bacterium TaxID=2044937 RepID=A0A9D5JX34_9BACT|nr:hypothetical protein [candidate division KSB3 bacterium]MBD3325728.1 hypothetical protein [candidate division KSB3 bacterium]